MTQPIAIRKATASDSGELERLRQRDSRPLPAGDLIVALVGGRLLAARSLQTGETVADPFSHTAHLRELLAVEADAMTGTTPNRLRRRVAAWLTRGYDATRLTYPAHR